MLQSCVCLLKTILCKQNVLFKRCDLFGKSLRFHVFGNSPHKRFTLIGQSVEMSLYLLILLYARVKARVYFFGRTALKLFWNTESRYCVLSDLKLRTKQPVAFFLRFYTGKRIFSLIFFQEQKGKLLKKLISASYGFSLPKSCLFLLLFASARTAVLCRSGMYGPAADGTGCVFTQFFCKERRLCGNISGKGF